jgi:hypothetical protein
MRDLDAIRHSYARLVTAKARVNDPRIVEAFAEVGVVGVCVLYIAALLTTTLRLYGVLH